MSHFELVRKDGSPIAISKDGYYFVHLERGTVRNEENADWLVELLNTALDLAKIQSDIAALRTTLDNMPRKTA